MTGRLQGKTALVTAAGQGIGRAIAEAFAREGASVIATDINDKTLAELDAIAGITARKLDVLDGDAIRAAAAEIGAVDILQNCAGFVHQGTILECDEDGFDFTMNLNVRSMYRMIRAFLPAMLEHGGGSIINIASVSSNLKGIPARFVYGTSKAAVIGLTKSVAADYIRAGVRCNAICPGTVQSPSLDDRINMAADPDQQRRDFIARQPMGRLGTTDEISAMAVYLAGDESAFTTGQMMVIDGGITI